MTRRTLILFVLIIFLVLFLIYFTLGRNRIISTSKVNVVASIYPLAYFAQEIGGERVHVVSITPSGAEPHDYDLTSRDIINIENSKLLLLNGLVEPWGESIKKAVEGKNILVAEVGDGLFTTNQQGDMATLDPHVWISPPLAKKEVENIFAALVKIDSGNENYYNLNKRSLIAKLDSLDKEFGNSLKNCISRNVVVSHAAFGYLTSSYGLVQVPISGLSPDAEPSLKKLSEISDFARKNNIKYIFFESLVSSKLSETIASEVGAKTLVLNPLEGLTKAEIAQGEDYFSIMKRNLENLKTALECK